MCGIVGYSGPQNAVDILLEGLENLEYRGYDSAGISVFAGNGITTVKAEGRLKCLREKLNTSPVSGHCGIAHTRWATHGEPSDRNAHPHGTERVMLVHNGIIENYLELRSRLTAEGYVFKTQTDTETAALLLDSLYQGDPLAAIREMIRQIEGAYALAILFADRPGEVYGVRKDNPLIAALGEGENFIASDIAAVLSHTKRFFTLEEGEIAVATSCGITVYSPGGAPVEKKVHTATWDVEQARKDGYPHFMLKEIFEQPKALRDTIHPRLKDGLPSFEYDGIPECLFKGRGRIHIVACGTAMYAGLVGRDLIETLARIPVEVQIASEFRYRDPILSKDDLVVIISQSGETADSLAALRLAKQRGVPTLGVVNVAGSTIAREADYVIYTHAGPEIAVASTKAYSVQVSVMYLLAFAMARSARTLGEEEIRAKVEELLQTVEKLPRVLEQNDAIASIAGRFQGSESIFFLGRGLDWALSQEGALKLKEISYIHCEAYAAGELKHGTISLITNGVPVVAVATQEHLLGKMVSNIKEVKARGAWVLLLAQEGSPIDEEVYDQAIRLPKAPDLFTPLLAVAALQLLAYHTSVCRGCDVDKPRNLAKSVTVE